MVHEHLHADVISQDWGPSLPTVHRVVVCLGRITIVNLKNAIFILKYIQIREYIEVYETI